MASKKSKITYKDKSVKELRDLAEKKIKERDEAKMEMVVGKSKNLKAYKNLKAEVARILTNLREKSILESLNKIKEDKN